MNIVVRVLTHRGKLVSRRFIFALMAALAYQLLDGILAILV